MTDNLKLALVQHHLQTALRDLEDCDCYGLLWEAYSSTQMALEFVEDEIERRQSS